MSVWTVPITWGNSAVTASQMNSLRDNLNFLKGSLDLLTGGTTADTGNAMRLELHMAASGNDMLRGYVLSEANPRFAVRADGRQDWGPGGGAGADVALFRTGVGTLEATGQLEVTRIITNTLTDALDVRDGGYLKMAERSGDVAAANIGANEVVFYAIDNGAGKTQLRCRFVTGNPIVLATQA